MKKFANDIKSLYELSEVLGVVSAIRYKLGIAREGVDFS